MNYNELHRLKIGESVLAKFRDNIRKAKVLDIDFIKRKIHVVMEIIGESRWPTHDVEAWLKPSKIQKIKHEYCVDCEHITWKTEYIGWCTEHEIELLYPEKGSCNDWCSK